jgi:superfamily II DNA or RNA helicase
MVKLFLKNKKLGVKISGENFYELKEVLKSSSFKFNNDGFCYQDKLWEKDVFLCKDALEELQEIEDFEISDEIKEKLTPKLETKKYRIPFKEEYLAANPLGDFQIRAIKKASRQTRLLFAHKQGLGKSYMIISAVNHIWNNNLADRLLVVCPTEAVYNFRREILKFATFPVTEKDISIADAENRDPFVNDPKIIIMKYRTFLMLSDDFYKKKFKKKSKDYRTACIPFDTWGTNRIIILDESHSIKEKSSRQTKTLHMHKDFFEFRYLLSGTPWPTGIKDLYSQMKFLDSNLIPLDFNSWIKKIADIGTRWSEYQISKYREEDVKLFMKEIEDWIIREFAEDNVSMPKQVLKKYYVHMSKKQRNIYKAYISYKLEESREQHGRMVVKEVYRDFPNIMLALENPCILQGKIDQIKNEKVVSLLHSWKFEDHSKLESISSLLDKHIKQESKKVVLWSYHPLTIRQLENFYKKYNPIAIHGEIEIPEGESRDAYKDKLLEKFKKDKKHKLLIASLIMLNSAVNIPEAPVFLYFDRNWNYTHWEQSRMRNMRIVGTKEDTLACPLILEHTLEENLDRNLTKKDNLDKKLMKYDSLTKEQWKRLFEGEEIE